MTLRVLALSVLILVPVVAVCDDAPPPPPPQDVWSGKGQLGFVESQGNTNSKSANAAIDMTYYDTPWKHVFHFGGLYGQSAGVTAAERWDTLWQSNRDITTDLFVFGALRYAHDLFSGFQYQATASAGLGYKFINTASTKLSGQIGMGYRRLRPEELVKDAAGAVIDRIPEDANGAAVFTAGLDYSQALTSTTSLSNKLLLEAGSSDTLLTDTLALSV
jgi:putative salt-induced outer membrane protein